MVLDGRGKKGILNKDSGRMPKIRKHTPQCPESHSPGISNLLLEIGCRIDFPIMDFWQLLKKKSITFAVEKCDFSVLSEDPMVTSLQETMYCIQINRGKLNYWTSVPPKGSIKLRKTFHGLYKCQKREVNLQPQILNPARRPCLLSVIVPAPTSTKSLCSLGLL